MDRNQNSSTLEDETARVELIDRMVQKSMKKESASEKDQFYAKNIPKVSKFTLDDCIDQLLEDGELRESKSISAANAGSLPVLRSFETVDFEALTKGFDPEEVKEGKLVLYITEAQLLQLLKQRAIIIPDKAKIFSSRDSARDTSRTSRVSLVDEKIQDKLGRQSPVNSVELVVDRDIQQLDDPNQDCDQTKIESPCPDTNQQTPCQTPCPTPTQTPRQTICQTPSQMFCQTPCQTPIQTPTPSRLANNKTPLQSATQSTCQSSHTVALSDCQSAIQSTCQTPLLPPLRESLQSNQTPSMTTQSLGEDCKRLLTFDQSERALSIIREYIDRASKEDDNCENTPRRLSLKPNDDIHKSPRVFNAFLNKIFDDNLKNRLIRDSAFEKGLDLLTELVDHVVDEAKVDPARDSYVEKGKVFESFTDYVHRNIPTYTEKTKQIAKDEQLNLVMSELSEFYNEALDCNGKRRSSIESHAEKVLKILGDFVDKELDEDFNGRLFTDEQSDMALTIIKDHLVDTIDECYHKHPDSRLKSYDRIDSYIDNFLQTRYSERNIEMRENDKKSLSVKSFDRIDNVIDSILQNRLSNATEKSFDRSDSSNYNVLQSRISITTDKNDKRQDSYNENLSQSRLSNSTKNEIDISGRFSNASNKSADQQDAEQKKQKNYERIDNAVDAVLQNRLSIASIEQKEYEKRCASYKSFDKFDQSETTSPSRLTNTEKDADRRESSCSRRSEQQYQGSRLLTDTQSDRAMSIIKEYVTNALEECSNIKLDDSQRSSVYERKASVSTSGSDFFIGCDRRLSEQLSHSPRIFDSFLNSIFDDNLKNKCKRNNSYQKGLNLLTEFVDTVVSQVKRANPPFDPFLEKGKLFENFSEFVSKNVPEFRPESSRALVYPSCVDDNIKKSIKSLADFFDDALEFNGFKSPQGESHEEKVQKILGDFVERISNHYFNKPYVGVEERSAQLPNMVGYRDKLSNQTDIAPKIFDTFLNKIFDDNLKNKLISDNSFDKGLSILTDLTDYVTNNVKDMNPSYDTFLENGKLFERFSEYVHKNISSDINLEAPPPKSQALSSCTDERLKRVTEALSSFYDNALDCNGKRRPTIESNAEKIQKILGDFVDRISNHYYNEPLMSIQEKQMQQIDSRTISGVSRNSKVMEPSVDTLKKIDDFIDHVLEKHKFKVEKGNDNQPIQTVQSVSMAASMSNNKKPEKLAVSVIHQNISAKKSAETCYIQDVEKSYKSIDHISKPLTIDAYQPSMNKIATAYDGVKLISPTVAQLNDGKLLKYKDFDLMVPSDYHFRESSSTDSKSHLDYIVAGSDGSDGYKSITEKTHVNFPKSYEFLNQGLNYVDKTEEDALSELDKFFQQLVSNLDKDTQRINWPVINKFYSTKDQREKADIIKKFINGLATEVKPEMVSGIIIEDKSKSLPEKTGQTLKILDSFVDHVLDKKPITHKITDKEAINLISDLINRLRDFLKNWKPIKNPELKKILQGNLDNKIIIKTTKKLPAKISVSGNNQNKQQFVKKKITYSYLDNYNPSTRVYELLDTDQLDLKGEHAIDMFNAKQDLNYLLKPFDPAIAESIGKPSIEQINKYLSIINTGVKNTDLIQIHPLLNSQTTIKNQTRPTSAAETFPKMTEPVIIDSNNYQKYIDDVSKHFSGLQITDFPLYVQGLEFKQNDTNDTDKFQQTFIKTSKESSGQKASQSSEGITIPEPNNYYTKQVANNSGNIQYVRVKSSNQIIVAQ